MRQKQTVSIDVPLVPGMSKPITDLNKKSIGNKNWISNFNKTSAGGGGKGMRIVNHIDEFQEQMQLAVSEQHRHLAMEVFIEKFVTSPRHIESYKF